MRAFRWAWVAAAAWVSTGSWSAGVAAQTQCPTFTPPPEGKAGVAYSAKVMSGPGYVQMVWGPPAGLTFSEGVLSGVPKNAGTNNFTYNVSLDHACDGFTRDGQSRWVRKLEQPVKIHDLNAPRITSFTVTPAELTASGGAITVELKATDDFGVARALLTTKHPDGHSGSSYMKQTEGPDVSQFDAAPPPPVNSTWKQPIEIPINTSATPVTYTFTVTASDREPNAAKAGPITVTVAGRSTEGLPRPPIRR